MSVLLFACAGEQKKKEGRESTEFKWQAEQFADARILRYQVPGFIDLTLNQKKLIYYLSEAALCGRDITYDQNYRYNLLVRKTLEVIINGYPGDRNTEDFGKFTVYLKRIWFSNGIHHHYSSDKFLPEFPKEYFAALVRSVNPAELPLKEGQTADQFIAEMEPILFNPAVAPKRVSLDPTKDLVLSSSCNFYEGVTQKEAEAFYDKMKKEDLKDRNDTRISYGLNSRLEMENGEPVEKVWKIGGMYSPAIEKIVYWLDKAANVAETEEQKAAIIKLIEYYRTGDLRTWDEYNILWLKDIYSRVDFVNGFIEVYGDPLALKATWESVVNFKNLEATRRTELISRNAQYFEDHSPVDPEFKKKEVRGVTAKVITVARLGGDCDPTTPIGINLPNAQWIRMEYGSKSVTMDNITFAYDQASLGNGFLEEFCSSPEEVANIKKYGYLAGNITTDLHECLGHASGRLLPGVSSEDLKNYHSAIEEARADLFSLYYIMDTYTADLGLIPSPDAARAEYDNYIRNGLMTQLVRIKPGKSIEQAHMRDRAMIAHWAYEKGKERNVVERMTRDGKTYFRINDYDALRKLFGDLLREVQRITSEGDYKAARKLVETYGVRVDPDLHKEVLERYEKLHIAPYSGFINPEFTPVIKGDSISDVTLTYPDDFAAQMLQYSKDYSFLPPR
jgi:dipeptidyl-peptidase-3